MRSKFAATLLAFPALGGLGAHKFYLGQFGTGLFYLLFSWTGIPHLVALFEFLGLLVMHPDEFDRRYNGAYVLAQHAQQQAALMAAQVQNMSTGSGPAYGAPTPARRAGEPDVATQIEKLNELRIAGLLTDEEFAQQKARILERM